MQNGRFPSKIALRLKKVSDVSLGMRLENVGLGLGLEGYGLGLGLGVGALALALTAS